MATTISQAFNDFKAQLEPTDIQRETLSQRQMNVRSVIEGDFKVYDTFLTGSYSRRTMIAPLSEADIDIFCVLDAEYFRYYSNQANGPAGLLDMVKRSLRKTYTRTPDISRNGQAVTIRFEDFRVDVIPAFLRQGGGYLIPNSLNGSWISTDPKKHIEIVTESNRIHNGDLVPLIKMVKRWNRVAGDFFYSFHLEVLALAILENVTITDFPSGVRYYFDKARETVTKKNPDPAGFGGDVGSYINTQEKIRQSVALFNSAYETAIKAELEERQGNTPRAMNCWRVLFGDFFPTYG